MLLKITTAMASTLAPYNYLWWPKPLLEEAEQVEQELEWHARKLADWDKDTTEPISCHAKQIQQYVG